MIEALQSTDIETLRKLAINAWRRAEMLEDEKTKAVEANVKAIHDKKVVKAKLDAVLKENEVLLARIAQLTIDIAVATNRDKQLALELELKKLRESLAKQNSELYGSTSERRNRNSEKKEKEKEEEKKNQSGHGPTQQIELPMEKVVTVFDQGCSCEKCGGDLRLLARQFEESELISAIRRTYVLKLVKRQKYACGGCGTPTGSGSMDASRRGSSSLRQSCTKVHVPPRPRHDAPHGSTRGC